MNPDQKLDIEFSDRESGFVAKWRVPEDLRWFQGHFPNRPILPAIATIDTTVSLISQKFPGRAIRLQEVKNAKFTGPIHPGQLVEIEVTSKGGDQWQAEWSTRDGESVRELASLRIILA